MTDGSKNIMDEEFLIADSQVSSWKNRNFRELLIWQRAHQLALEIYPITKDFPREELYGVTSQIRRAAVSTAANIVEGSKRRSPQDFCHFLNMAQGSNAEVQYFLILSRDLGLISSEACEKLSTSADQLGAMIHSFVKQVGIHQ